jgi:dihydrofolate synthase/folylpolyglutamate synthase
MQKLGGSIEHWPFRPTFFEFATVLALLYFREQKCELVIWETGMGGRLDATNIVTPLASVITNIQLDHQQWLGATLPQIAREKAGIIKPGIPVVTAATGDALEVIRSVAREKAAPLTVVEHTDSRVGEHLHLRGAHQRINASVALATVDALQPKLPARPEAVTSGLALTRWAGRLQELRVGNAMVLLDGAHNPDGARSLADALDGLFPTRERTLVIGLFRDKAWAEMCDILVPGSARVFLAPMQSDRSADLERVAEYCQQRWPNIAIINAPSSAAAMDAALAFPFVVVAGSLHLIGEVLQHLGVAPADAAERRLNEWDADRTQTEHKLRK